jgi:eukaryotic-like serine/threonine-protein kinase
MHPERIGPYRIERKIGAGGMGNVYLGVHDESAREAAIKVLPGSMAQEEGFVQRFHREIKALRKVSNQHIVELFEDGETTDGCCYYAMEFVDGPTLTAEIHDRKRIPWREVILISEQIAAALKASHDAGIVHRDLKPSNLMLTDDGIIKLTDFGVAALFAEPRLTRTGGIVGTAEYMSPEQARGVRPTKRSDLYSLGAVMYVMLTGRPPFSGQNTNEILRKQQFDQFDKPGRYAPETPRLLEDFICQLLEKDAAKRPPDALVVMKRLEQIQARIEYTLQQSDEQPDPADTATREVIVGPVSDEEEWRGPGPATIVRNFMLNEAAAEKNRSVVSKFFDNTWVLITLLGLIIAGGFYFAQRNQVHPREHLAEAKQILAAPPSVSWLRARNSLLQPLLDEDLLEEHHPEIREMIRQIDQYEFCRSLKTTLSSDGTARSEIERLMRRAFDTYSSGDPVKAELQLQDVIAMLKSDPEFQFFHRFLTDTQAEWTSIESTAGRREVVSRIILLESTPIAADDRSAIRERRERLEATLRLYGDDESLTDLLDDVRQILDTLPAAIQSPSDSRTPAETRGQYRPNL